MQTEQVEISATIRKRFTLLMFALAVLVLMLWLGIFLLTKTLTLNFVWGGGILLSGIGWLTYSLHKVQTATTWKQRLIFGIFLVCLLDWVVVDRSLFVLRPVSQVMEAESLARFLAQQRGEFRVYSPSYSLPQQTAVTVGLEFASGVDPVQLRPYLEFMTVASGVPAAGYSVTIPVFKKGNPEEDNRAYQPRADLLGLLNVRYILSAFLLDAAGLEKLFVQDGVYVYENQLARPRAWIEQNGQISPLKASMTSSSPNRLVVQAQGPGELVLSEIVYPGWRAYLDGKPVRILAYQGLLRSVELPEGDHQVKFLFQPASLWLGLLTFCLTVIVLGLYSYRQRKRG